MSVQDTINQLAQSIQPVEMEEGKCNCLSCRKTRALAPGLDDVINQLPHLSRLPDRYNVSTIGHRSSYYRDRIARNFSEGIKILCSSLVSINESNALLKSTSKTWRKYPTRYDECPDCGKLWNKQSYGRVVKHHDDEEERVVCTKCSKSYRTCLECGEVFFLHETHSLGPEEYVCKACSTAHYTKCWRCDGMFRKNKLAPIPQLAEYDGRSTGAIPSDRGESPGQGVLRKMCHRCHNEALTRCTGCGEVTYKFTSHRIVTREGLGYECQSCHAENRIIQGYSYKPAPSWLRSSKQTQTVRNDTLMMGVELEVEPNADSIIGVEEFCREIIKKIFPKKFLYCKTDSSIRNGIEIVSHPFSYEHFKENQELWQKLFEWMFKCRWSGASTRCGGHIHLTKRAFTSLHLHKFIEFIMNTSHRQFIEILSERRSFNYCGFDVRDMDTKALAKLKKNLSGKRNSAVNLQPSKTVELRFFSGVSTLKQLNKNIEFVDSLYNYTLNCSPRTITVAKYAQFLVENAKHYKNIVQFLQNMETFEYAYPIAAKQLQEVK